VARVRDAAKPAPFRLKRSAALAKEDSGAARARAAHTPSSVTLITANSSVIIHGLPQNGGHRRSGGSLGTSSINDILQQFLRELQKSVSASSSSSYGSTGGSQHERRRLVHGVADRLPELIASSAATGRLFHHAFDGTVIAITCSPRIEFL